MKKWLCLILAAFILSSSMGGCGKDTEPETVGTAEPVQDVKSEETEPPETEPERVPLGLPELNYDGASLTIMSYQSTGGDDYHWTEFAYDEEMKGEVVNEAIGDRNRMTEELLNVSICNNDLLDTSYTVISQTMMNNIMAADTSVDVYTPFLNGVFSAITQGQFVNLYEMPMMNIENEWWDLAMNRDLAMNKKLYFQAGDILLSTKQLNGIMQANVKVLSENNIELPYEIVMEGKWTWDVVYDLCSKLAVDLNGDGIMNEHDQWGFTHNKDSAYWLFVSAGGQIAKLDDEGVPVLVEDLEHNLAVLEKMAKIYGNKDIFYDVNTMPETWTTNANMFKADQVAIRPASVYNLLSLRDMEGDFGILPNPKADENQKEYRHNPVSFRMAVIVVPVTNTRLEMTGAVLEALAYYSKDTTAEAYYETTLRGKISRDGKSRDMLEIVFSTVCYDLIESYRWGNMFSVVCNGIGDPSTFSSGYISTKKTTAKAIEKAYAFYAGD